MTSRLLTSALIAGAGAGLIAALLQLVFVQPILLHAELYESGQLVHFGADPVSAEQVVPLLQPLRDGLSILFTMLNYTGWALLLVAGMALAQRNGHDLTVRGGLLWGIAGFVAAQLAPSFSLPPEVPGLAAAEVAPRQIWWVATVASAGLAMWLIAFGRTWAAWGAAIALLLAPHLIGAPQPEFFTGTVPPELSSEFAARTLGTGLAAWVMIGVIASWLLTRENTARKTAAA